MYFKIKKKKDKRKNTQKVHINSINCFLSMQTLNTCNM